MQTLIEIIVGLVAAIAATALAQFDVDVNGARPADREIRRMADCPDPAASAMAQRPADRC